MYAGHQPKCTHTHSHNFQYHVSLSVSQIFWRSSTFSFFMLFFIFYLKFCFFSFICNISLFSSSFLVECVVRLYACVHSFPLVHFFLYFFVYIFNFFVYNFRNITFIIIFYTLLLLCCAAYLELSPFFGRFQSTNSTLQLQRNP